MIDCGNCHTCGTMLEGDYCPYCRTTRRYRSHGCKDGTGRGECPHSNAIDMTEHQKWVYEFDLRSAAERGMKEFE